MLTSKVAEFVSSPTSTGFEILSQVATEHTVWSFIYNISDGLLIIKDFLNKSRATIVMSEIDFSPNGPWKLLNLESRRDMLDDLEFHDYSFNTNLALVESFFENKHIANLMGFKVPIEVLKQISIYPEQMLKLAE